MTWIDSFIIPLVQVLFIELLIIGLLYVIIRPLYRIWFKKWKWVFKYKTTKHSFDNEMIELIKGMEVPDIKKNLLLEGFTIKQINELLYLKERLGGKTNAK